MSYKDMLSELDDSIKYSGRYFGKGNADKAAGIIGAALAISMNEKAARWQKQASEIEAQATAEQNADAAKYMTERARFLREKAGNTLSNAEWYNSQDGQKYLQDTVIQNRKLFREIVKSAEKGDKLSQADIILESLFIKGSKDYAETAVAFIYSAKSVEAIRLLYQNSPATPAGFKGFAHAQALPLEHITPAPFALCDMDKTLAPLSIVIESARDLYSAYIHNIAYDSSLNQSDVGQCKEIGANLHNASLTLVAHQMELSGIKSGLYRNARDSLRGNAISVEEAMGSISNVATVITTRLLLNLARENPDLMEASKDPKKFWEFIAERSMAASIGQTSGDKLARLLEVALKANADLPNAINLTLQALHPPSQQQEEAKEKTTERKITEGSEAQPVASETVATEMTATANTAGNDNRAEAPHSVNNVVDASTTEAGTEQLASEATSQKPKTVEVAA